MTRLDGIPKPLPTLAGAFLLSMAGLLPPSRLPHLATLPGDVPIGKGDFSVFLPIATIPVATIPVATIRGISLLPTVLLGLLGRLLR